MNCPAREQLEEYLIGTLDPVGIDAIDEHLEHCTACLSAVETLDTSTNAVFSCLRQTPLREPQLEQPALDALVKKAKALASPAVTAEVARPLTPGTVLGNYVIGDAIAAGGMGLVYKAEHRLMKRTVALKVLPAELFRAPQARMRFQREVQAVARLASPHIVAAYDAGDSEGRDYLVMEYVAGRTLAEHVKSEGPFEIRRALECILQIARGLAHAHAAGIIHRDIKPANVIVTEQAGPPLVKILDMGLARIQQTSPNDAGDLTSAQVVMGTAAYMAPEQAADTRNAGARADLYSLGCTLFFLLTGRPPYEASTSMATLLAHREQPIPSLRATRPDCPASVDALFHKLVAKDPERRPTSASDVCAEVKRILGSLPAEGVVRKRSRRGAVVAAVAASIVLIMTALSLSFTPTQGPHEKSPVVTANVGVNAVPPLIDMVPIGPGEFWIGASDADTDARDAEKPQRRITMTQGFLLGKTEVTQGQYQSVMGTNPSIFSMTGRFKNRLEGQDTSDLPVDSVSWLDAIRFCNKLSERAGLPAYYEVDGNNVTVRGGAGYRLPTEAEWEYAGRGDTATIWSFGADAKDLGEHAWFAANSAGTTHPVGRKKANAFGLYDMHGNVAEWCWDRYDPTYYKRMPLSDPPGSGQGATRVYRGGGWNDAAAQTRASARESLGTSYSVLTVVGFRVARNLPQ